MSMPLNACVLKKFNNALAFEDTGVSLGKLTPKDKNEYQVVITSDNPDIKSLVTEKRLTEQAAKEIQKQIGYNIKIWHQFEFPSSINSADITIEFKTQDPYFTSNILAYAGYPNGGLRGRVVFNNAFAWLDGYIRTGAELAKLGIYLPGMIDDRPYGTFNYRQTVKHEGFGHAFGLQHTQDEEDVMHPIYGEGRTMYGKQSKSTLNTTYGTASFLKTIVPDDYIKAVMKRHL